MVIVFAVTDADRGLPRRNHCVSRARPEHRLQKSQRSRRWVCVRPHRGAGCSRTFASSPIRFWASRSRRPAFQNSMDGSGCVFRVPCGTDGARVEQSIEYARTRRQFGQPVGKFQRYSTRSPTMKIRMEGFAPSGAAGRPKCSTVEDGFAGRGDREGFRERGTGTDIVGAGRSTAATGIARSMRSNAPCEMRGHTIYSGTSIAAQIIARFVACDGAEASARPGHVPSRELAGPRATRRLGITAAGLFADFRTSMKAAALGWDRQSPRLGLAITTAGSTCCVAAQRLGGVPGPGEVRGAAVAVNSWDNSRSWSS